MSGAYGQDGYGDSPYGSVPDPTSFRVASAASEGSFEVLVSFSYPLNLGYAPLTQAGNYTIPGLTVTGAFFHNATTIRLVTSLQGYSLYTVTVAQAQNALGDSLDPLFRSVTFTGTPLVPVFRPVGVRSTRIRLAFTTPMLLNSAIVNPASYAVTDIHGQAVSVLGVTSEQGASSPLAVVLTLASSMHPAEWYVVTVGPGVVSASSGLSVVPDTQQLQWVEPELSAQVSIGAFTGEAFQGLLAGHAGLVYFSPALDVAVSGSVMQVDSVEVCTKAYDEYHFPEPVDPPALYTFGGSSPGLLNSTNVLWAAFPRLVEAKFDLGFQYEDTYDTPTDGPATATLTETWDPTMVALLNNPAWTLYDGVATTTPPIFICADNLWPIPAGATTVIVLAS